MTLLLKRIEESGRIASRAENSFTQSQAQNFGHTRIPRRTESTENLMVALRGSGMVGTQRAGRRDGSGRIYNLRSKW